ncbi:MAG: hypothetical protein OEY06_08420 [Gammaproteobacteria bacterium]|nr:hypothetical protein [Gammaproteobacteria bacterium]
MKLKNFLILLGLLIASTTHAEIITKEIDYKQAETTMKEYHMGGLPCNQNLLI